MIDKSKVKVIAFDVFGTVFDLSGVNKQEIKDYAAHIKRDWAPLKLPASWETLPAHPDAKNGIDLLRQNYIVVTCSNGPLGLLTKLSKYNHISWDAIIPLELNKVYKPRPEAYLTVSQVLDVPPESVLIVTANEYFGDLEGARAVGMQSILIRKDNPKDIIELNQYLT